LGEESNGLFVRTPLPRGRLWVTLVFSGLNGVLCEDKFLEESVVESLGMTCLSPCFLIRTNKRTSAENKRIEAPIEIPK